MIIVIFCCYQQSGRQGNVVDENRHAESKKEIRVCRNIKTKTITILCKKN